MEWMQAPWADPAVKERIERGDFASPTVRRWREDIKTISDALTQLQSSRQVYTELGRIIAGNQRLQEGNLFLERLFRWYVDHTLMAIRRDVDRRRDVVSLQKLLQSIKENRDELTLPKFRLRYTGSEDVPPPPNDIFVSHMIDKMYAPFADLTGKSLDREKIQADIDALAVATDRLETLATESVAHRKRMSAKPARPDPLYMKDVHAAVDMVEQIVKRYMTFLTGAAFLTFTPVDQTDWPSIFNFTWRVRRETD